MVRYLLLVVIVATTALAGLYVVKSHNSEEPREPASNNSEEPREPAYHMPESIARDCSKPVEAEISRFLAKVPNGSKVVFAKDACYGHDLEVLVSDREELTIDGNGSTFKPLTPRRGECRATWRIQAGRNIHLKNMVVRGRNITGFDGPRQPPPEGQCQSAFSFESVQGGSLTNSKAFDTIADPLALQPDKRADGGDYCKVPPNRDIVIDRFEARNAGRTVAVTNVDGLTIKNSYFGDIFDNAIDIETDVGCEWSRNIKVLNNRFGRSHFGMLTYTGGEPPERSGGLEVVGNVVEAEPENCFLPITVAPFQYPAGQVRRGIVIRGNRLKTRFHGIGLVNVGDARIEQNVVSKNFPDDVCSPDSYVVTLHDSHKVRVSKNVGISGRRGGFKGNLAVDSLSTEISSSGPVASLPPKTPAP